MSVMSERESQGCRRLLSLLPPEELLALSDTVTNRLITVENYREAIEAIIAYSQNAEELLKRRKVHREIIFKYLAVEGIAAPPSSEKNQLIKKTLELWSSGSIIPSQNTVINNCANVPDGLSDPMALGKEFCQWFFTLLNSLNPTAAQSGQDWRPQHFWADARLLILSQTGEQRREEFHGAELVCRRLSALVGDEKLFFCPNLEHPGLKCISTPHGLVLVAVAGTVHRENVCLGIFEQVFGLIRDPQDGNRWKMKLVHLKVRGQIGMEHLPMVTYNSEELLQLITS